jgi:hypothetical protein
MKAGTELFKATVRAVLVEHCVKCHGGEKLQGEVDLATRESLLASGMVDLQDVASSHLLAVVRHESEPHMPQDAPRLPDEAVAALEKWLALGAPYDRPLVQRDGEAAPHLASVTEEDRQFWSFQPLRRIAPPLSENGWARTPIDAFVLQRLQAAGLEPNPETDRRRLARRAYWDLIGLPPTEQELAQFLRDDSPQAYERLIETLLDSPHYGERWARHWMDLARYGESHGYEQDYDRPHAYTYRDFLIRALNQDLPYDEFVRWQIAGDELAPGNPLAMMATGFLGAGVFPTQLTEAEFESARYDELDDMCATLGTAVLGLSVGCARCHTHKFDPIPGGDYYRLAANFSRTIRSEIELDLDPDGNRQRRDEHTAALAAARAELAGYERGELEAEARQWLQSADLAAVSGGAWDALEIATLTGRHGSQYARLDDGSWLARGTAPAQEVIVIEASPTSRQIAAVRLEVLAHDSLPQCGPGRAGNGNFALGDIRLTLVGSDGTEQANLRWAAARATHEQDRASLAVAASIDDNRITGWAVDGGGIGQDQAAVFDLESPVQLEAGQTLRIELVCEHPNAAHAPGRMRLSTAGATQLAPEVGAAEAGPELLAALRELRQEWNPASAAYATARAFLTARLGRYQTLRSKVAELEKQGPRIVLTKAQVTSEDVPPIPHHADGRGYPHFYPQVYQLGRGDVAQKRGVAEPGFLQVLVRPGADPRRWSDATQQATDASRASGSGDGGRSRQRAAVARWITDVEQGAGALAARVIVNRVWQHHFGRGIVATPSDFGRQGEAPTHPELLEWLATDFVEHGWQLKRLHKLIMLSAVYRQTSEFHETRAQVDRENRLLWRFPPRRLEAEAIRDTLLTISGQLDRTLYGPGTLDPGMRRRSIYFFIKRSQLIPLMVLFDWPEHQVSIAERPVTTVAPQALALMNNPECRKFAEGLARRALEPPSTAATGPERFAAQVQRVYGLALGREPEAAELELGERFLREQAGHYAAAGTADAELRGLVDFSQAVLSLSEVIYVD